MYQGSDWSSNTKVIEVAGINLYIDKSSQPNELIIFHFRDHLK